MSDPVSNVRDKEARSAGRRDAFLCYCQEVSEEDFKAHIASEPNSTFEAVCAETGLASKCTACLLNAEQLFIETKRQGTTGVANKPLTNRRASDGFSKQRLYGALDAISPKVARTIPGIIPIIAGPEVSTILALANSIPPVIGQKTPAFDVKVETRDAEGRVVGRHAGRVEPGKRLEFEVSRDLPASGGQTLRTGGCFLTYRAVQEGYLGSIRPHYKVVTPCAITSVHSAGRGRDESFMESCFLNEDERQFVSAVNCTDQKAKIVTELLVPGKSAPLPDVELPPRGSKLIPIPREMVEHGKTFGILAKSDREVRWHYLVEQGTPPRVSLDHI